MGALPSAGPACNEHNKTPQPFKYLGEIFSCPPTKEIVGIPLPYLNNLFEMWKL